MENKTLKGFALFELYEDDVILIDDYNSNPYIVTKKGLFDCKGNVNFHATGEVLAGAVEWHKLPWRPTFGEPYFTFERELDEACVVEYTWENTFFDFVFLRCGIVFRTEKEAELEKDEIIAKLTEGLK